MVPLEPLSSGFQLMIALCELTTIVSLVGLVTIRAAEPPATPGVPLNAWAPACEAPAQAITVPIAAPISRRERLRPSQEEEG